MKRVVIGLILCLAMLTGVSAPVIAQESQSPVLSRIVKSGEFRVGMSGNQPPFSVKSKEGKLIGYEVELAAMLANAMGVKLQIVERPFSELLSTMAKGEVDAVMSGLTMTPERNLKAAFVGPYVVSGKSILTKSSVLAAVSEVGEINRANLTLVVLENSTSQRFVEQLLPEVNLVKTADYDAGVKMVLEGTASAMVADFPICALSVMRYGDQGLVTLTQPLTIEPIGIALPPGDSLLLNMVENYLGALEAVGVLEELEQKWFEDASWLIQVP